MTHDLAFLFHRELENLRKELELYPNEESLWIIKGDITNTAGNLALHLCGNLLHYIGAIHGETGYIRNRDAEFSEKGIPLSEIFSIIKETQSVISTVLAPFPPNKLTEDYPAVFRGGSVTNSWMFQHLYGHFTYHLGQVNYHRRIITG